MKRRIALIAGLVAGLLAGLPTVAPALANVDAGVAKWRAGDWNGAVAEWVAPAARGDADALFNMGQAYRLGRGVPQDPKTAIDYYRRAAEKGHVAATANLGITLWQQGRKTEALTQLRTAADRGDLRAAYVLGVATFEGDVAPRNPALGYAYVVRAREGGLALASGQSARMATRMTAEDRARGEAAAQALAAGRPVAVVLAEMSAPAVAAVDAPVVTAEVSEESAEEAPADERREPASKAERPVRTAQAAAVETPPEGLREKPQSGREAEPKKPAGKADAQDKAQDKAPAEGWKVQLGAYANERAARTAWATLVSQSATLLKGKTPVYNPRGGLVRLQVGPFEARPDAAELCAKLAAAGRPCFVTK
jgi:cell division septation protein DedD